MILTFSISKTSRSAETSAYVHSVDGRAGKIVGLFQVEYLAFLHLIGREVLAALSWLRAGHSVGAHNQCLPLLVSGRPVAHAREF